MFILFCGSRSYRDVVTVDQTIRQLREHYGEFTVLHGGARGADTIAGWVAKKIGLRERIVLPDWPMYGRRAGFLRNTKMLEMKPELVVAFWDGGSKGTAHTIDCAINRYRIPVLIKRDEDSPL